MTCLQTTSSPADSWHHAHQHLLPGIGRVGRAVVGSICLLTRGTTLINMLPGVGRVGRAVVGSICLLTRGREQVANLSHWLRLLKLYGTRSKQCQINANVREIFILRSLVDLLRYGELCCIRSMLEVMAHI